MWSVLLLVLVAILVIKYVNLRLYWKRRGIVYEPLETSLYRVLWRYNTQVAQEVLIEDGKKYGKVYGSYRAFKPSLVVSDLRIAREVLIKQFGNFFERSFEFQSGDPLWDMSLSHLPHDQWKSLRSLMGYCFTSLKMRSMIPKLDKVAKRVIAKLELIAQSRVNELNLQKYLSGYGMDSIAAISFGLDLDCINNPDNDFVKYGSGVFKPGISLMMMILCPSLIKYCPFVHFPPKDSSLFFSKLGKHIIAEKRKNLDEVIRNNTPDILDLHLIAQREDPTNEITDDVLVSQSFLFFLGGLDTSVTTLEFCVYYLTVNPDIQQQVYEEIKQTMGDRVDVEYSDVHKMKLLEASFLESLRLVPVVAAVDRICTKDTTVDDIEIQRGMIVEFFLPAIHRDPDYFPDPDKFMPQRFLKDGDISTETAAFLSFGDGPKGCIGRRLALMNMQVLLANMLLKVRLERCPSTPEPLQLATGLQTSGRFRDPPIIRISPRQTTE